MEETHTSRRKFIGGVAGGLAASGRLLATPSKKNYQIELIELFVRMTPPGRLAVAIGKNTGARPKPERNPIAHVRMVVSDDRGNKTFGCSGDRMSVRWLDKRPGRTKDQKLRELVVLCEKAREVYLAEPEFDDPFRKWLACYTRIHAAGRAMNQEDLTSSFAAALLERAMLDAVCRLSGEPIFNMVKQARLGFDPAAVLPELRGFTLHEHLPAEPRTKIHVRHTVGKVDPLRDQDVADRDRLDDGLPQTLEEYVRVNGLTKFKLKSSGDVDVDLARMKGIWSVLPRRDDTLITVDANEAYPDLDKLEQFVD